MTETRYFQNCHYPLSNVTWFPRHSPLDRATFDLTFRHPKRFRVVSVSTRSSEETDPDDTGAMMTRYQMAQPVAVVTFALGGFKRHKGLVKWDKGDKPPTPVEFNSLVSDVLLFNEDFLLAELNNSIRYFTKLFGDYPYPTFAGVYHPFDFAQGLPSLLLIPQPPPKSSSKFTYNLIGHETAHQWWGNIVSWRSYRDQWLSEGFAEYSGILYTGARDSHDEKNQLLRALRTSLKDPPQTFTGLGKGRLVDVGPIILGHRLSTAKTLGSYDVLTYNKGALVLRMLHFMLTDPETGDDKPFSTMMTDFVERYRNKTASTDDFRNVANEHFARSPIARNNRLANLNWLFSQFVYQSAFPSYEMEYKLQDQPGGKVIISGTVSQKNAPYDWVMVLPVKFSFAEKQFAIGTVMVQGAYSPFQIELPARPKKVELDPERWILAEGISTKELK